MAPADDELFPQEQRNRTQEILTKGETHFSVQVYSGVGHGFAVSLVFFFSLEGLGGRKGGTERHRGRGKGMSERAFGDLTDVSLATDTSKS